MSDLLGTAYASLSNQLTDRLRDAHWPTPEAGFVRYLRLDAGAGMDAVKPAQARLSEAPILASNGYLYACEGIMPGHEFGKEWSSALEKILQRDPFPADRESYFYRPLETLGICLGAKNCQDVRDSARQRLRQILRDGQQRADETAIWSHALTSLAAWHLGINWKRQSLPLLDRLSLDELCLLHWLLKQGDFGSQTGLDHPMEPLEERLLQLCFTECVTPSDAARAAIILLVSRQLVEARISSRLEQTKAKPGNTAAAEQIISNLARRFHSFKLQISKRHGGRQTISIDDEYDVQDALHSLMKLYFDDVRPEEWTPSYAGTSTRMDFLLKQEKIVVEAKMTRNGLDQKTVIQQLTEDIGRYRSHPDCKTLICLVYDPEYRCKNPVALENDVSGLRDNMNVIVHVFPKP